MLTGKGKPPGLWSGDHRGVHTQKMHMHNTTPQPKTQEVTTIEATAVGGGFVEGAESGPRVMDIWVTDDAGNGCIISRDLFLDMVVWFAGKERGV